MKSKIKFLLAAIMLLAGTTNARAQANISGSQIDIFEDYGTLSSNMTCTDFDVRTDATLTVNQGVTLTLNCLRFKLYDNSDIELHGTMTGSAGSDVTWSNESYIYVILSDGAKYTVTGLSCSDFDGDSYLRYFGYDAATDGHGTVTVTDGPTTVTSNTLGSRTTTYTFTATPASGYRFVNWTKGAGGEVLGTAASIAVSCEQNGQYQVYANFEEVPVRTLDSIPMGWTVQVGSAAAVSPTAYTDGGSATKGFLQVEAGQQVLLVPSAEDKPRVKSVTLEEAVAAPAAPDTAVAYSFDNATSPSMPSATRVDFDYAKTSVITNTAFLNAFNNENGDPAATSVSLGTTNLSDKSWTLSFEWAACGGCNNKPDHTTLKSGSTTLFDFSGSSNFNATVTIIYSGSDGTKTLPVPICNKNNRFTNTTGNQLNTTAYWHHVVITGGADGVKMTITNSSTGTTVVQDVVLSATNVNPTELLIEPCCGGAIGIDELLLIYTE